MHVLCSGSFPRGPPPGDASFRHWIPPATSSHLPLLDQPGNSQHFFQQRPPPDGSFPMHHIRPPPGNHPTVPSWQPHEEAYGPPLHYDASSRYTVVQSKQMLVHSSVFDNWVRAGALKTCKVYLWLCRGVEIVFVGPCSLSALLKCQNICVAISMIVCLSIEQSQQETNPDNDLILACSYGWSASGKGRGQGRGGRGRGQSSGRGRGRGYCLMQSNCHRITNLKAGLKGKCLTKLCTKSLFCIDACMAHHRPPCCNTIIRHFPPSLSL